MKNNSSKTRRKLTCFISATPDADLGPVKDLLRQRGIEHRALFELPARGLTIFEKLTEAISKADLFIAILASEESNANICFELGFAYALKKPVLIVASPGLKNLPVDIQHMFYIRADTQNHEAISFALDQVLAAPKEVKRRKQEAQKKTRPIGAQANELIGKLDSLGQGATHRDLEEIVKAALQSSGVSVVAHSKEPDTTADFAVWVDEIESVVGNPLIIEIKKRIADPAQSIDIRNQMLTYLAASNCRAALVLYMEGEVPSWTYQSLSLPSVYFFQIGEFLAKLRNKSFGETIRDLRNAIVHRRIN